MGTSATACGDSEIVGELSGLQAGSGEQTAQGIEDMKFRRFDDGAGNLIQLQRRVMTGKFLAESFFGHLCYGIAKSELALCRVLDQS